MSDKFNGFEHGWGIDGCKESFLHPSLTTNFMKRDKSRYDKERERETKE
jgi:hypothetical protein